MSSPEKEVLKSKICCSCEKEKEIKNFYVNRVKPDGYDNRCRACKIACRKCKRGPKKSKTIIKPADLRPTPMLFNVREDDWVDMYRALERIGYDLSKDIHLQFCELHGLKPRKRMSEKSVYHSPKDLGLV